jgi:hypothetical protein
MTRRDPSLSAPQPHHPTLQPNAPSRAWPSAAPYGSYPPCPCMRFICCTGLSGIGFRGP